MEEKEMKKRSRKITNKQQKRKITNKQQKRSQNFIYWSQMNNFHTGNSPVEQIISRLQNMVPSHRYQMVLSHRASTATPSMEYRSWDPVIHTLQHSLPPIQVKGAGYPCYPLVTSNILYTNLMTILPGP